VEYINHHNMPGICVFKLRIIDSFYQGPLAPNIGVDFLIAITTPLLYGFVLFDLSISQRLN